ncbi:MAG TPA: NTPase [Actinomycetota bacterium]|jgi:nucleoside-triphosphatase
MKRPRLLLEGRPGIGKTTVIRRLVELLRERDFPLRGFTTEEIRDGRRRIGFEAETVLGQRAVLAHIDLPGPPRVGKYGVDLPAFEKVVLPVLRRPKVGGVVVIDELGKMELASARFREEITGLLDREVSVVATVHVYRHPYTEALKARPDVEVIRVNARNRDALPARLLERLSQA